MRAYPWPWWTAELSLLTQRCFGYPSVVESKRVAWLAPGAHRNFIRLLGQGRDTTDKAVDDEGGRGSLN